MRMTIAGLQAEGARGDIEANLLTIETAAADARARGADILVTPEMFVTGYDMTRAELEPLVRDDLADRVADVARTCSIAIVAGFPERVDGGISNSALFVDTDGEEIVRYRKAHLFGDLDRSLFVASDTLAEPIDFRGVKISLMICCDVEFAETVRRVALAGADVVIVPTAQMAPFEFIAEQLVRTRAWENQVYLAYVNRCGSEGDLRYVGRSSILSPTAEVLDSLDGSAEGLVVATIDTDAGHAARAQNPYLADRRPEL